MAVWSLPLQGGSERPTLICWMAWQAAELADGGPDPQSREQKRGPLALGAQLEVLGVEAGRLALLAELAFGGSSTRHGLNRLSKPSSGCWVYCWRTIRRPEVM